MNLQTLAQKRGEVIYRSSMTKQHLGLQTIFKNEYSHVEMHDELKKRIKNTKEDIRQLLKKKISISPFLEIGSEYCIRSAVLINSFGATGHALDIAHAPLVAAPQLLQRLGFSQIPPRITADAHKLPFANKSLSFVFCYQTLHHFPDPLPIIKEVKRVLAPGGVFFCAEEPVKQELNFRLFRRPTKPTILTKLAKWSLILPFISEIGRTEVQHGILEGSFSLAEWERLLKEFNKAQAYVTPLFGKTSIHHKMPSSTNNFLTPPRIDRVHLDVLGGGIKFHATRSGKLNGSKAKVQIVCPKCRSKLKVMKSLSRCKKCHSVFPIRNGVPILIPKELRISLYGP